MKLSYRKTLALGILAIAIVLIPLLILAEPKGENIGKGFCERLSNLSSRIGQRISDRNTRLDEKRSETANRIEERRQERDSRYEEKREKWDSNREQHFAKLEEKAEGDEQKQAVVDFTKAIKDAISARRDAIYNEIQDFRQGVNDAKVSRKTAVDDLVKDLRDAISAAFEKAEADCTDDVDPKTVQENLRNDLKAAKEEFIAGKQEVESLEVQMEALIAAKREAMQNANDDFRIAIEQARDEFKSAVPEGLGEEEEEEEE